MKKILLALTLIVTIGLSNQTKAQCNGATVTITNFVVLAPGNTVLYSFDWTFVQGNASIQVVDSCNGSLGHTENCIPRLKDSTTGVHHVTGSFTSFCNGTLTVAVLIWTNPSCGGTSCVAVSRTISHTPLPVSFTSFTAQRSNSSTVKLSWQTATEVNNRGFAVERNTNGTWEQIAFIASQASAGNSSSLLNYSYIDANSTKGISQYRIKQVDLDNKSSYTEIRAVRGIDQPGKIIVYPNPSSDGKVNIVFEDASAIRDVSLIDMSGRTVKQWNGVSNNNLQIDNLVPGFYSLRVVVRETGVQSVEKIVINKR
jgi:hypothetical protein